MVCFVWMGAASIGRRRPCLSRSSHVGQSDRVGGGSRSYGDPPSCAVVHRNNGMRKHQESKILPTTSFPAAPNSPTCKTNWLVKEVWSFTSPSSWSVRVCKDTGHQKKCSKSPPPGVRSAPVFSAPRRHQAPAPPSVPSASPAVPGPGTNNQKEKPHEVATGADMLSL